MDYPTIAIEDLKPYENNARLHPQEQIDKIENSINEFGFITPVIIDENNMILVGHGRTEAAKQAGLKEVPYKRVTNLTDEQKRAYILADNKLSDIAEWDEELLQMELDNITLDMSAFGFDDLMEQEFEVNDDDFKINDIEEKEPISKQGEVYKLGEHILMCGDSTESKDVETLMGGELADLVLTDPPYNIDYSGKNERLNKADKGNRNQREIKNDNISNFSEFLYSAYKNMVDFTKEGGAFYIWYAHKEEVTFRQMLMDAGVLIHETLIWAKNHFVLGSLDYQPKHEPCLYGWKQGAGHYFIDERNNATVIEDRIDFDALKKSEAIQLLKDIYNDNIATTIIHENKPHVSDLHPTMKPVTLMARLIRNSSRQREIVMDLFGGSGTTLIACEQLNRRCRMMEYEPIYVDTIINRWEQYTGKKAERIK